MNRYQLAKIVDWAGAIDTRKRMQKVVYLLQVAGCPLEVEFTLHHYGPYSQEVARLTDEMVKAGILDEQAEPNRVGQRFSYRLSEDARRNLTAFEATPKGQTSAAPLKSFEELARQLVQTELKELEYAATVVFFHRQGHDWAEAIQKMCQFKGLSTESQIVDCAGSLARWIHG